MENNTKLALGVGVLGALGYFLFTSSDAKAATSTTPSPAQMGKEDGCAQAKDDVKAGRTWDPTRNAGLAKVAVESGDAGAYLDAYAQAYEDCGGKTFTPPSPPIPAKTGGGGGGGGTSTGTILFSPDKAKDPVRAHDLAVAIGNSKPSDAWATSHSGSTASDGTFLNLYQYSLYPGNLGSILAFQDAAGLSVDGKYGTQTNKAFEYWYDHGGAVAGTSGTTSGADPVGGTLTGMETL